MEYGKFWGILFAFNLDFEERAHGLGFFKIRGLINHKRPPPLGKSVGLRKRDAGL